MDLTESLVRNICRDVLKVRKTRVILCRHPLTYLLLEQLLLLLLLKRKSVFEERLAEDSRREKVVRRRARYEFVVVDVDDAATRRSHGACRVGNTVDRFLAEIRARFVCRRAAEGVRFEFER